MKKRKVRILSGGGGSRSTGKSCALDTNVILNLIQELTTATVKKNCHREGVSPWRSTGGQAGLLFGSLLKILHLINCGRASGTWIATRSTTARNDAVRQSRSTESRAIKGLWAYGRRIAFTMAEILLSLTIIGVVAAITLPSLTGNINERTWNTQRKALYARFSQAISLMPALNGYGTLTEANSSASAVDTAAETFITAGLSKVLKMTNICDSEHLSDCGLPDKITPHSGSVITPFPADFGALNSTMLHATHESFSHSMLNTKAAAFETQNGESVAVYYNPNCVSELSPSVWWDPIQNRVCANFIYDLNGKKGPNTYGKDIGFITVLYSVDSVVVAPLVHSRNATAAPLVASGSNSLTASKACTQLDENYRLPTKEEAGAMFVNQNLIGSINQEHYWTSSLSLSNNESRGWAQSLWTGARLMLDRTQTKQVRCVKRD